MEGLTVKLEVYTFQGFFRKGLTVSVPSTSRERPASFSHKSVQRALQVVAQIRLDVEHVEKSSKFKNTRIELAVQAMLRELRYYYEPHAKFGRYEADIFLPQYRLVIECDGEPWHSKPEHIEHDRIRDAYFAQQGIKTLRLPGKKIAKMTAPELRQEIQRAKRKNQVKALKSRKTGARSRTV